MNTGMLTHYASMALRNLRRAPFVTALNFFALAIGFAAFFAAYAASHLIEHVDGEFPKSARTFVITTSFRNHASGFSSGVWNKVPAHVAKYLKTDFPEFAGIVRLLQETEVPVAAGDHKIFLRMRAMDAEGLDIFELPFKRGNSAEALSRPRSIVLTDDAAKKLFGETDPLGQQVVLANAVNVTVTGIVEAVPRSHLSSMDLDILASWDVGDAIRDAAIGPRTESQADEWWISPGDTTTFGLLKPGVRPDAAALTEKLKTFVQRRVPAAQLATADYNLGVVPMTGQMSVMLDTMLLGARTGVTVSGMLMFFGILVLTISCVSYANLATAQAAARVKDIGTRKVLGASLGQIVAQCLFESAILSVISMLAIAAMLGALVPILNKKLGLGIRIDLADPIVWVRLIGLMLLVNIVAGLYPAIRLARVNPVEAVRTGNGSGTRGAGRLIFIGSQFLIASFFLVSVFVMSAENDVLQRAGHLVAKDPLFVIENPLSEAKIDFQILQKAVQSLPDVQNVTGMTPLPWSNSPNATIGLSRSPEANARQITTFFFNVADNFFQTLDVRLLAGRSFDREHGDDNAPVERSKWDRGHPISIVVDDEFVRQMGYARPQDAIGQPVYFKPTPNDTQPMTIIGVVEKKLLQLRGLGISASVYSLSDIKYPIIRVRDGGREVRTAIQSRWDQLAPNLPLRMRALDERFDSARTGVEFLRPVFIALSAFSFGIAAMALFGMAVHATRRRLHEIGVRKTLGATTGQVVRMLLRSFSVPAIVANLMAWPIAFAAMRLYLSSFVYRAPLTLAPFVSALVVTLLIACGAVAWQAFAAARVNPSEVLHYE